MSRTVGCRTVTLHDETTGTTFPMLVLYPSTAPNREERIGPYVLSVAMDGPPEAGTFPLVIVSHGTGGSYLVYRDLAAHLARRGFVVAMPEHPGNNRNDDRLQHTAANLANRPRHLRLAIDWTYADASLGSHVAPDAVAVIGHSMGGYTALAVAGGVPTAFAHETPDRQPRVIAIRADPRVKALVLLAPATAWYMVPGALAAVRVPVLLLSAERDEHAPLEHAELVVRGVPDASLVEHHVVPNAGHFAFLTPFPAAMVAPTFPPSQDPPGFDRAAFQAEMHAQIEAFLRRVVL